MDKELSQLNNDNATPSVNHENNTLHEPHVGLITIRLLYDVLERQPDGRIGVHRVAHHNDSINITVRGNNKQECIELTSEKTNAIVKAIRNVIET